MAYGIARCFSGCPPMTSKTYFFVLMLLLAPCAVQAQSEQDMKICNAEDAQAALPACTRLIEVEKLDATTCSTALSGRAAAYWRKREFDRAISDAAEAIQLNPNNSDAYMRRGASHFGKGDLGTGPGRHRQGN